MLRTSEQVIRTFVYGRSTELLPSFHVARSLSSKDNSERGSYG